MKNKQFVEYSKLENRFKIDQLLYLDVDSQTRADLVDLFSILSDNPMYKVLSKRKITVYFLLAIALCCLLMFTCLYFQFRTPPPAYNANVNTTSPLQNDTIRLLGASKMSGSTLRLLPVNNSTEDPYSSNDFGESSDFPDDYEAMVSSFLGNNTQNTNSSSNQTQSSSENNTKSDQNVTNDNNNNTSSVPSTPVNNQSNQKSNQSSQNNNQTQKNATDSTNTTKNEKKNITNGNGQDLSSETPFLVLLVYILLIMVGFLVLSLSAIECRKSKIFENLKVFEETTLKSFHEKTNNRIIITSCHEKLLILNFSVFSIFSFKFLVHSNGTDSEGSSLQKSVENVHMYQEMQSESAIYNGIEEEGEKYHNAVVNLNKQLKNE